MSKITIPGLIDPHVHLRTPGQEEKEDFYSGTSAALSGGYTTILDMPNNRAPITTKKRLEEKIKIAKQNIVCDVGFYFGSLGDNLDEFAKVQNKVMGLKLYLNETTGNFLINKKILKDIFAKWNSLKPILLHAEDDAVAYVIEMVRQTGKKVHFCHISTASDLKQIVQAKEDGLPISCGVTPHHLFLTEPDAKTLGPFGKMKPPLRSKKDVNFLWKNLHVIDAIESDHAPHTVSEKQSENPPYGVPGLETTLPLLLTAVSEKRLNIEDTIRLCYTNPSKIFNVKQQSNTYVEIDLHTKYQILDTNLFTKCSWSPFNGWGVKGKITKVILRGKPVFENDRILVKPGFGKILNS